LENDSELGQCMMNLIKCIEVECYMMAAKGTSPTSPASLLVSPVHLSISQGTSKKPSVWASIMVDSGQSQQRVL